MGGHETPGKTNKAAKRSWRCAPTARIPSRTALALCGTRAGAVASFELSGAFAIDDDETRAWCASAAAAYTVERRAASHEPGTISCAQALPPTRPDGSIASPARTSIDASCPSSGRRGRGLNFVVGWRRHHRRPRPMPHPADKSRPKLPQGRSCWWPPPTRGSRACGSVTGRGRGGGGARAPAPRIPESPAPRAPRARRRAQKTKPSRARRRKDAPRRESSTPPPPASGSGRPLAGQRGYAKAQKALKEELEASAKLAARRFRGAGVSERARVHLGFGGDKGSAPAAARDDVPFSALAFGTTPGPVSRSARRPRRDRRGGGNLHVYGRHSDFPCLRIRGAVSGLAPPSGGKAKGAAPSESGKPGTSRRGNQTGRRRRRVHFGGAATAPPKPAAAPRAALSAPLGRRVHLGGRQPPPPARRNRPARPAPVAGGFNFGGATTTQASPRRPPPRRRFPARSSPGARKASRPEAPKPAETVRADASPARCRPPRPGTAATPVPAAPPSTPSVTPWWTRRAMRKCSSGSSFWRR